MVNGASMVKMMQSTILLCLVALASCRRPDAEVNFVPGADQIKGRLEIFKHYGEVIIVGTLSGLTEGLHGIHVHEKGDLSDGCRAAGGHFNPFNRKHGAPSDKERHVGDLGNIVAGYDGVANVFIRDAVISLDPTSPAYISGLAIVIHAGADDLGRGGNEDSLKTGNAGGRSGCGIIHLTRQQVFHVPPRPVQQVPQPVQQVPQPVQQVPQQGYQVPQPVHQLPQPVQQVPQQGYQVPQPVHQLPQPVHQLPQPGYQLPHSSYQLPQSGYQQQ
ncbi:superoxide dismutase [Cu-Zn]-like isoform X2 [Panulirus ornatus]